MSVPENLLQSRNEFGYRFYRVEPNIYTQLAQAIDNSRGYPLKITQRGLPLIEELIVASDDSGYVLVAVDEWRFEPQDDALLEQPIALGLVEEITKEQYDILSVSKPEEEQENDLDILDFPDIIVQ